MVDRSPITAVDKLRCAEREVSMRERVYPKWVDSGRMSSAKADQEIAVMRAIADDYRTQVERERLL